MDTRKLRWLILACIPLVMSAACRGNASNSLHETRFIAPEQRVGLDVDRHAQRVTFHEDDRTVVVGGARTIERAFAVVPEAERPLRCPTQAGATRVEVLDLGPEPLTIARRTYAHPTIEAACIDGREAILTDKSRSVEPLVFAPRAEAEACTRACDNVTAIYSRDSDELSVSEERQRAMGEANAAMVREMLFHRVELLRGECDRDCNAQATRAHADCLIEARSVEDMGRCGR